MNARTVCRICKTEGVRLHCITSTHLQEMFERDIHTLLTTDDNKPTLACIECCDRLQHCYQLRNDVEHRENTHTMMNLDPQLQIDQNDIHQNNACVEQSDLEECIKMEPEHLSDVEVKQESTSDLGNVTLQDNGIVLEEYKQISDTDHGSAPRIIKVESLNVNENEPNEITRNESCEEQEVECGDVIQRSYTEDNTLHNHKPSQDIPLKTLQILLQRCDNIIDEKIEVTGAPKSENPQYILRKQKKNDETRNNTEETLCEKDTFSESRQNQYTLRNHVPKFQLERKSNAFLSSDKTKLFNTTNKHFECDLCKRCFNLKARLIRHIRKHTVEKRFECKVCKKCFSNKSALTIHIRTHTGEKPYECEVCKKSFSQNVHLALHTRTHTGEKPYKCDVCKKGFSVKTSLDKHARIHTGEKPYECEVCKKCFYSRSDLTEHTRRHTGEKPYECDFCKKRFSDKSDLKKHTRKHTGEKPYKCDVCQKYFSLSNTLARHARTHTDEKPFECDVCNKRFSLKINLINHTRIHTGEKPYECDVCKKRFIEKSNLKSHSRTHTGEKPYECNVCKKFFSFKCDLAKHTLIHTGEKPYECDFCKKRFSDKSDLKKHTRKHTGEKPYKCDVCQKYFSLSNTLARHARTHTDE